MGSDTSKFNNCCSCLETQVGEERPNKNNLISLQRNNSVIAFQNESFAHPNNHYKEKEQSHPQKPLSMCFIGEKQSGKTTLINALRGKPANPTFPTAYPERNILRRTISDREAVVVMTEVDFDFITTHQGKEEAELADIFVFVLKYYEHGLFRDQIRKIASHRDAYRQGKSFKFVVMLPMEKDSIRYETVRLLTEYSLPITDIFYFYQDQSQGESLGELLSQIYQEMQQNKQIL